MKSFKGEEGWQFFKPRLVTSVTTFGFYCRQAAVKKLNAPPHDWSTSKQSPWHIFMEHHYTVPSTTDVCSTASIFHPTIIPPSHAELQGKFWSWPKSTIARSHCQQGFWEAMLASDFPHTPPLTLLIVSFIILLSISLTLTQWMTPTDLNCGDT